MTSDQFPSPARTFRRIRSLKIEAAGDFWKGDVKPKIRLAGHWLELAGFKPGERVRVICAAPGVIELRSVVLQDETEKGRDRMVQVDLGFH